MNPSRARGINGPSSCLWAFCHFGLFCKNIWLTKKRDHSSSHVWVIDVLYLCICVISTYYGGPQWSQRVRGSRHSQRPRSSCLSQGDDRPRWSLRDNESQQRQRDQGTVFYIWVIGASYLCSLRLLPFLVFIISFMCIFLFWIFCIIFCSHWHDIVLAHMFESSMLYTCAFVSSPFYEGPQWSLRVEGSRHSQRPKS